MKSEELRRLTASEPLTLEQEYVMQHSWQEDADSEKWRPRAVPVTGGLIPGPYRVPTLYCSQL